MVGDRGVGRVVEDFIGFMGFSAFVGFSRVIGVLMGLRGFTGSCDCLELQRGQEIYIKIE